MVHTTHNHHRSVVQGRNSNPITSRTYTRILKRFGLALLIVFGLGLFHVEPMVLSVGEERSPVDATTLYELTLNGAGDGAVRQLATHADARGGWGPAPGDTVAYDPDLALSVRASVRMVDFPPDECTDPIMKRHTGNECKIDFTKKQDLVRFGYSTFVEVLEAGNSAPRLSLDDLLSVYIEEVGHSWQEYHYETEGRGSGERTRLTSAAASSYWAAGSEYQVKMYILSLDGTWLLLSDTERDELKTAICADDGYANPMLNTFADAVPDYGPPPDWPNPEGWPTAAPTMEEFQMFCNESGLDGLS
jgi:hypothetical protein